MPKSCPYYRWNTNSAFPERRLYLNLLGSLKTLNLNMSLKCYEIESYKPAMVANIGSCP